MLCVLALEKAGITPDKGDVLVTGAAGGVGSVAIALLDKLGYRVVASSRRAEQERDYLQGLGADEIIDARELSGAGGPLDKERWAGAVDSLGSRTLANVLSQIKYDGAVAACGLAQGPDLPATVMPFILRDVTLAGVNSVLTPREKREEAWGRLATDLDLAKLNSMTSRARLEDVPAWRPKSSREKREAGWSSISENRPQQFALVRRLSPWRAFWTRLCRRGVIKSQMGGKRLRSSMERGDPNAMPLTLLPPTRRGRSTDCGSCGTHTLCKSKSLRLCCLAMCFRNTQELGNYLRRVIIAPREPMRLVAHPLRLRHGLG